MAQNNFVDFNQAKALANKVAQRLNEQSAGLIFKGSKTFATLPSTLTQAMAGYVYNMSESFTTDSRFVEGSGKDYPAGTNVAVADCSTYEAVVDPSGDPSSQGWYELVNNKYVLSTDTEVNPSKTYYVGTISMKFDVASGFIDVESINDRIDDVRDDVAEQFSTSETYKAGDIVMHNDLLYKFKTDHSAGAWNSAEVDATNIAGEIVPTEIDYDDWMQLTQQERETGYWFVTNWPSPTPSTGFNLPILCAYGGASGIGGVSAKYNYWFGIYASSGHQIPAISAGSNCTVTKLVDHKENVEDAFALYAIEKTNKNSGATISESYIDARSLFGISEFYDLGEFTKSNGNESVLTVSTDKPLLLCAQSGLSSSLYPIINTMNKGEAFLITRCQYGSYDNGEIYVLIPEDGEIDLAFTHGTIYAYAEINN